LIQVLQHLANLTKTGEDLKKNRIPFPHNLGDFQDYQRANDLMLLSRASEKKYYDYDHPGDSSQNSLWSDSRPQNINVPRVKHQSTLHAAMQRKHWSRSRQKGARQQNSGEEILKKQLRVGRWTMNPDLIIHILKNNAWRKDVRVCGFNN
jgi:hypothetical protein